MNKILLTFAAILLMHISTRAQDIAPLQLGNVWVYEALSDLDRYSIIDTNILIDTVSYFKLKIQTHAFESFRFIRVTKDGFYAIRKDSTYPSSNNEEFYYKLNAKMGETWTSPLPPTVYTIEDTIVGNVFGEPTTVKYLVQDAAIVILDEYWTEKFGNLSSFDFGDPLVVLKGCVIDGVVYGDTSFNIVKVTNENKLPNKFMLKQNYPNPFNPETSIAYNLHEPGYVNLTIYNLLGKIVAVLVDEFQESGNYVVQFSTNKYQYLASGVYIYKLSAGSFTAIKKLVLLK